MGGTRNGCSNGLSFSLVMRSTRKPVLRFDYDFIFLGTELVPFIMLQLAFGAKPQLAGLPRLAAAVIDLDLRGGNAGSGRLLDGKRLSSHLAAADQDAKSTGIDGRGVLLGL